MIRILLAILLTPSFLLAFPKRDARGSVSENYLKQQGIITLDLKKIHYRENDKIPVKMSITNTGNEVIRIFPSGRDLESYRVVVRDENGNQIPERDEEKRIDPVLKRKNTIESLEGKEIKEIILHKDEVFSKEIDLNSRFDLEPGKKYFVTAYFHPNIQEMPALFIRSRNQPYFFYEEKHGEPVLLSIPEKDPTADGLEPEEVIHLFLGSEKKKIGHIISSGFIFQNIYRPTINTRKNTIVRKNPKGIFCWRILNDILPNPELGFFILTEF
ncbi:hypothetical protein LEP1GSC038_1173 [Leptospira weilii str. 2006001855]|uniref:Uncharacterized protein n=1 Tax=Leptospira weilii str. 2006001855 TaxID=996804 RepID=M6FK68_9LEPT|nr:hypothetical protein LEP1GSC038_1173 [Leptospira weilii str. 2006001855]